MNASIFILLMILTGGQAPVVQEVGSYSSAEQCRAAAKATTLIPNRDETLPAIVFACVPSEKK